MAASGRGEGGGVRLESVDTQQLAKIKESLTNELSQYARSGNQLMLAANKFEESRQAIAELAQNKEGHQLLLPLTQSLYVNGTVAATDKVMIDIGTGYYVEMASKDGQDYCKRKVEKLQESLMGVQQIMRDRQGLLNQVNKVTAERMQLQQQQQQQQQTAQNVG